MALFLMTWQPNSLEKKMNKDQIGQPETEEQRILDEDQEYQEWLDSMEYCCCEYKLNMTVEKQNVDK